MKKELREMLKTIINNQELIMKSLKIEIPIKKVAKESKGRTTNKVAAAKKTAAMPSKKAVKK